MSVLDKLPQVQYFHDVTSLINLVKMLNGRNLFMKLIALTDIVPLESSDAVFPGEMESYLESLNQIFSHLLAYAMNLNEIHGKILMRSSKCSISKTLMIQLEKKDEISDFSIKINNLLETDRRCNRDIIGDNENWCLLEKNLTVIIDSLYENFQDVSSQEQTRVIQMKKLNKIRHIKLVYHVIMGLLSLHYVDYESSEEFRSILCRVHEASILSV